MKFFDPKKKETTAPNNPASTQRPANVQNPNPANVSNPHPQPGPAPSAAPVPQQQPRVEAVKPEPQKMEPPKPEIKPEPPKQQPITAAPTISMPAPEAPRPTPAPGPGPASAVSKMTNRTLIGNSVTIRGDITSDENLQIEGIVDGSIESNNDVIVGHEGRVNATIRAVNIIIQGKVVGDVAASNRVELAPSAMLQGNIRSPKLSIAETAKFRGSVDMRPKEATKEKEKEKSAAPVEAAVEK